MPTFTSTPCLVTPRVVDFLLIKARQVWPKAVAIDKTDEVHGILSPRVTRLAEAEIYPSEEDFLRVRDRKGTSQWLAVQAYDGFVTVFGDDSMVEFISGLPVWKHGVYRSPCQTRSAS
jgi:hypothetical protein